MYNNTYQKKLWLLAILIPLLLVWGGSAVTSFVTGSPFNFVEELVPRLLQTVIVAIPFVVLIFVYTDQARIEEVQTRRGANLALLLIIMSTLIFWGYYWFDGISYQLNDGTGGANIGLGILMLISPVIISILIPLGLYFGKDN